MLKDIIDSFLKKTKTCKVLCIGDLMLDRFLYGTSTRISPEAPVPVVEIYAQSEMLGGAGNVVRNIAALGAQTHFVGTIGKDVFGDQLSLILDKEDRITRSLIQANDNATTVKTRIVSDHQQLLRTDIDGKNLDQNTQKQLLDAALASIEDADVVVLSDYGKGVLFDALIKAVIEKARAHSIPVIVDPKRPSFEAYAGATLITPNLKEFQTATKSHANTTQEIVEEAHKLIQAHNLEHIVTTRSKDGMTITNKQGEYHHVKTVAHEVFDVSGAGDTVVAAFALCLALKLPLEQAAEIANLAAGVVVQKLGTATVSAAELKEAFLHLEQDKEILNLMDHKPPSPENTEDVLGCVYNWRQKGLSIGFTNGCFDLLHVGHIKSLKEAKAQCDRLVVGLNSDASVRTLKGKNRPVNDQNARAEMLLSLACVDAVVIFDEETPRKIITQIRPDVLIKGADYQIDQIAGAKEVLSWGGRVHLVELVPGKSTTALIEKSTCQ